MTFSAARACALGALFALGACQTTGTSPPAQSGEPLSGEAFSAHVSGRSFRCDDDRLGPFTLDFEASEGPDHPFTYASTSQTVVSGYRVRADGSVFQTVSGEDRSFALLEDGAMTIRGAGVSEAVCRAA